MYLKKDLVMDKKKIGVIVGVIVLAISLFFGYTHRAESVIAPTTDTTAVVVDTAKVADTTAKVDTTVKADTTAKVADTTKVKADTTAKK